MSAFGLRKGLMLLWVVQLKAACAEKACEANLDSVSLMQLSSSTAVRSPQQPPMTVRIAGQPLAQPPPISPIGAAVKNNAIERLVQNAVKEGVGIGVESGVRDGIIKGIRRKIVEETENNVENAVAGGISFDTPPGAAGPVPVVIQRTPPPPAPPIPIYIV